MSAYSEWAHLRDRALSRVEGYSPARTTTDIQMIRKRWSLGPFLRIDSCKKVLICPTVGDPNRLCFKVYPEVSIGIFCLNVSISLPMRKRSILL